MPEKQLFEYAVVRIVPKVEREEFINAGVVLFCSGQKFLQMQYHVDEQRLKALCAGTDLAEVESYLHAFMQVCAGDITAGPIAKLSLAGRFRWLTATRSTIVQTSKVHPGLCEDAMEMLQRIYKEQVC